MSRSRSAALAGLVAALAGLGVGELLAGLFSPSASPLVSLGGWVVDLAPPGAKDAMIAVFGTGDKPALIVLLVVGVAVVGALLGLLETRRPPWGKVGIGLAVAIGIVAATTRPDSALLSLLPAAAGGAVSLLFLERLLRRVRQTGASRPELANRPAVASTLRRDDVQADRRSFLRFALLVGAAGALATVGGQFLGSTARRARDLIASITLPAAATTVAAPAAGASAAVSGITPLLTPNDSFYRIDTALVVPQIDPATWTLRITGMVEQEVEITWDELLALPLEESYTTLICVSNEVGGDLISTARWLGYPIRELLKRAAPTSGADMVLSRSVDGFTAGTPLEAMTDARNAIVAVAMNGEPLPAEHGFPARLVVPGLYGYVSATKWVTELKLTRFDAEEGYWTPRGWSAKGPVKLSSRIDVARASTSTPGSALLAGVAWAPQDGIAKVEVQLDEGAWKPATLAAELTTDTWRQWSVEIPTSTGGHVARVRATSTSGIVQTADEAPPAPDGSSGLHSVRLSIGS